MNDDDLIDDEANLINPDWTAMRETTLAELEVWLGDLDVHASSHDVLMWLDRLTVFLNAVKAVRSSVFEIAIEWIKVNGDLMVSDQIRYTIGHQRTVRCLSVRDTLHAALSAVGGDLDAVATLLSASAWKHGACRSIFTQSEYERFFAVEVKPKLVRGQAETPLKLIRIDDRYSRRAGSAT